MHIVLMGLRGSGKSTLARALAERLGRVFEDLDASVLELMGFESVAAAWSSQGEEAFREAEREALASALDRDREDVIALGGGTPTAPGAADLLSSTRKAALVYLRCTPESLRARLLEAGGAGVDRPSLTGADPLDEIEVVFARRDPLYQRLAHAVIECDEMSRDETLERLEAVARRLTGGDQAAME